MAKTRFKSRAQLPLLTLFFRDFSRSCRHSDSFRFHLPGARITSSRRLMFGAKTQLNANGAIIPRLFEFVKNITSRAYLQSILGNGRAGHIMDRILHPKESRKAINTGRMAYLHLKNSRLMTDSSFDEHEPLQRLLQDPGKRCFLFFPGPNAQDIAAWQKPESSLGQEDATWSMARSMYRKSRCLQALPQFMFHPPSLRNLSFGSSRTATAFPPSKRFITSSS